MNDLKLHPTKGHSTNSENLDPRKYCPFRTRSFSGNKEQRHSCQQPKSSWCCRQTHKYQFSQFPGQRRRQITNEKRLNARISAKPIETGDSSQNNYCIRHARPFKLTVFVLFSLETALSLLCRDLTPADSFPVFISLYFMFFPAWKCSLTSRHN